MNRIDDYHGLSTANVRLGNPLWDALKAELPPSVTEPQRSDAELQAARQMRSRAVAAAKRIERIADFEEAEQRGQRRAARRIARTVAALELFEGEPSPDAASLVVAARQGAERILAAIQAGAFDGSEMETLAKIEALAEKIIAETGGAA